MNEIRDLMIGIDFGKKFSQICYYDRKENEARSVSMKVGADDFEVPMYLCKRVEQNDYCIGAEASYFASEKDGILIEDLYGIAGKKETVSVVSEEKQPWELLAYYLQELLKLMGVADIAKNTKCLVIAAPEITPILVKNLEKACEFLGFSRDKYMILDYGESFYYYCLTQKRETWNRSVGWYDFDGDTVSFRRLSMDSSDRPVRVSFGEASTEKLTPESDQGEEGDDQLRDVDFYTFAKQTLGMELYSSIMLTGHGFDQSWAKKSIALLCQQRRKVFYGNNLFARGACAAGKEKLEDKNLKGYRYMSPALVLCDVGMDMRVMGSPAYYPLIEAGKNWYECNASCELILDDMRELTFVVGKLGEKEKKHVTIQLDGLPKRPNKTTRLSLSLEHISPKKCQITVRDLGFGEMFPSSGKVWKDLVEW